MKIQLPIINIESDEYEYAISALMSYYGMPRAGAKAYFIKIMTDEAKMSVRNLVCEFKQTINYDNGQKHLSDVNKL
jgi:hypothetical protein